ELPPEFRALVPASDKPASAREERRALARLRRETRLERRRDMFAAVVAGHAYEEVAAQFGVHVATVRREVDLALAARAPDSADRYVALQLARLQKALRLVDGAMEVGDLGA